MNYLYYVPTDLNDMLRSQRIMCLLSFSVQLQLTGMDRRVLRAGCVPHALQQCVYDVENATSHAMVTVAVLRLSSHLVAAGHYLDSSVVQCLGWTDVLTRWVSKISIDHCIEPLFFRFNNVSIPFQDLLIPFFTVSDLPNSVFYCFRYLKFCFIFFKPYFWCQWFLFST